MITEAKTQKMEKLSNGEIAFTCVVPEYYASGLLAEAEIQKIAPEDYFQRAIDYAVSQDWLRVAV
jgi:hypothetical protein